MAVTFSPDGRLLAVGGVDGPISLWDPGRRARVGRLTGHKNQVTSLAFSPDGRILATTSDDTTVRVWDVGSGQQTDIIHLRTNNPYAEYPVSVAFSPDGTLLASGGKFVTLHARDGNTGEWRELLRQAGDWAYTVLFSSTRAPRIPDQAARRS